ncbi:hypothetical protein [Paenibacillus jiagnxiensis]
MLKKGGNEHRSIGEQASIPLKSKIRDSREAGIMTSLVHRNRK